jgi:hypothetical protein
MLTKDWQDKHLDKDILIPNNKMYSPEACMFVTLEINNLMLDNHTNRNDHPLGVHYDKTRNKFKAELSVRGKNQFIGRYSTPEEAHLAYRRCKSTHIRAVALKQEEPLRSALMKHADSLYVSFL